MKLCRYKSDLFKVAAIPFIFLTGLAVGAQALSVLPVNIFLAPGQSATTMTITNQGTSKTAMQIRAFAWSQKDGEDQLANAEAVVASPPIASIEPGGSQVVRLILRLPPLGGDKEATYRILVDQIPPPAEPGVVHVVLRLSIPIFALPATRAVANVQFHVEVKGGQIQLVGFNDGLRHEALRDIEITTRDGRAFKAAPGSSPYILAGSTRRWSITTQGPNPVPGETLRLSGHSVAGTIEEQVSVTSAP